MRLGRSLVDRMRYWGLTVVEVAGCYGRGKPFPYRPDGALRHWTAGGRGAKPSLGVVTHGRSDLPGPLCQVLQSREKDARGYDVIYFVADGIANHAGKGLWNGISGNSNLLGNEIEWSGPSEAFDAMRILTSELVARAMLDVCAGTDTNDVAEHREYALPKGRKIDTNLDGNVLRNRMRELAMWGPPHIQPEPTPKPEETDMLALITCIPDRINELPPDMRDAVSKGAWLLTDGKEFWWCPTRGHAASLHYLGVVKTPEPVQVSPSLIKELRPRSPADMNPAETLLPIKDGSARHFWFDDTGRIHPQAFPG